MPKARLLFIDYAKALCIIGVVWYMAIIPQDQIGLILLATVLTFVCCLGIVPLKDRLVSAAHMHRL